MPCGKRSAAEAPATGSRRLVRRQSGFSIVEALIALALLFASLLSIANLYIHSLRDSSNTLLRTRAANLAAEIAERIRANPNAGVAYSSERRSAEVGDEGCGQSPSAECLAALRAADDLAQWERRLSAILPDADNNAATSQWSIVVDGNKSPRTYVITLYWQAPGAKAPLSYVLNVVA